MVRESPELDELFRATKGSMSFPEGASEKSINREVSAIVERLKELKGSQKINWFSGITGPEVHRRIDTIVSKNK